MLKVFRDNIKYLAWILWAVIGLFVFFTFADFGSGIRQQGPGGTVAARVGDRTVTMDEFERQYRQLENMYRQLYGGQMTPEVAQQLRLPMQALDRAINEQILLAEAERMGLEVTDEELRTTILAETAFQDEQGRFIGQEKYERVLQANQLTVASFEAEMRRQILREKLNEVLRSSVFVSDAEVEKAYRDQVERARIRYIQLPRTRFQDVQISPADLSSWYESHKQQLKLPEQREGTYLLVEPDKLRGQVNLTDQELRQYYDSHKQEFERPEQVQARHILLKINDQRTEEQARQQIEQLRQRIQGGADFAAVAREASEDTSSGARGGDLGSFGRGQMVKEFEDAAFSAKPGEMVTVKSPFGVHLLQVTGKQPGGVMAFDQAKEQIRLRLAFTRAGELAEQKARELAERLKKNPQDFAAVVKENPGVTSGETGRFGTQTPVAGLGISPAFSTAAFGLQKGAVSDAIQVPRGWAVFHLKEVYEPRVPELKDVEPQVRMAVAGQKQQERAVQQLRTAASAGKTLDQVAAELGLEVKETEEFGGEGTIPGIGYNPELAKAAMEIPPGKVGGPVADAQGALLFEVKDRKAWDPIQFSKAREETRSNVQQEKVGRLLASLIEQRRRELGVEYDRQLLESFGVTPEGAETQPS
ncbi:MAG TPA: peptidyl-prolyl cis-trans isomerase [Thermoanaerobaculia bacterium]